MSIPILLWNPINVIEGEGKWIGFVLILLSLCWCATRLFHVILGRVQRSSFPVRCVVESLYRPIVVLLWILSVLFSVDMVTEHWPSESWSAGFSSVVRVVSVLAFGWFLFRYKKQGIAHLIEQRQKEDPEIREVLLAVSKMLSVLIVITMLFLMHESIGLSMTTLLAFGGVGGLALAIASQEIVQNFFGGFMLHMTRPFFHGDSIALPQNQIEGTVERIGWYQTLLRSNERSALYVPNAAFTRACIFNKSRISGRLLDLSFFLQMPKSELYDAFCEKMEESLTSIKQMKHSETTTVWIEELYGKEARIRLQVYLLPIDLQQARHVQTHVMLMAQTVAEALGGQLSSPPPLAIKT